MEDQDLRELRELQDPESWNDRHDNILPPAAAPGAVVAVTFPREEFARVAAFVRRHGMKTAEFIRTAALDRVTEAGEPAPSAEEPNSVATDQAIPVALGHRAESGT